MCLQINLNPITLLPDPKPTMSKRRKIAYKVVLRSENGSLTSVYRLSSKTLFVIGSQMISDRKNIFRKNGEDFQEDNTSLTRFELKTGEVEYGFHVFTNLKEARQWKRMCLCYLYQSLVILKCEVEEQYHVADGMWTVITGYTEFKGFRSAVYSQLKPIAIIE